MKPLSANAPRQLHFLDRMQQRYEAIRPILLLGERTAAQRAEELHLHPGSSQGAQLEVYTLHSPLEAIQQR